MKKAYKNYINHFRRTNKVESLRTIFNYNKKYNLDILNSKYEIDYVDSFDKNSKDYYGIKHNIMISQLLPIIREIIANGEIIDRKPLKTYKNFADSINKGRSFTDGLYDTQKYEEGNEKDILKMLWILGHEQFHLQKLNNNIFDFINTFYGIYSDKELNDNIKDKFNIDILEIYSVSIGIFIILNNSNNFYIDLIHEDTYKTFNKDIIKSFIDNFTISLDEMTVKLKGDSIYMLNEKSFKQYGLKELLTFPIFKVNGKFISPIHQLIINRVTNFLYFDIIEGNKLGNEFGGANERYIFSILKNINSSKFNLINIDEEYIKAKENRIDKNKIIDFIVYEDNSLLLFECKSNCLSLESKQNGIIEKDKKRIVEALYQLYFGINTIINSKTYIGLENINVDKINILPILSYLFQPFINFGSVRKEIIELLSERLVNDGIDSDLINRFPFMIIDNTLYNHLVHIINTIGIDIFIKAIVEKNLNSSENEVLLLELYNEFNIDTDIPFYNKMLTIDTVISEKFNS